MSERRPIKRLINMAAFHFIAQWPDGAPGFSTAEIFEMRKRHETSIAALVWWKQAIERSS